MNNPEPLIEISAACLLTGVSRQTIHRMILAGKLKAFTLPPTSHRKGEKRYLLRSEVERYASRVYSQIKRPVPMIHQETGEYHQG